MVAKAVALMVLAVGLAAPAAADSTDDAFLTNLNTSGMDFGSPDKAIQVAKTIVCGSLHDKSQYQQRGPDRQGDQSHRLAGARRCLLHRAAIQALCPTAR
ncbi:DUF732 domain-containing protein [Mycobacterium ulcerans]|uniref:DUF732 domain-containing protein n=1 Tax=Mycobacterium ulcerans TaxID=1809 RepID=UPI0011184614|nr:DUF732 domain-containing protein [Mycobacterium ulcerans]